MKLLLDTNVCIALLNGTDKRVRESLIATDPEDVVSCAIVKAELAYGARNSGRVAANLRRLDAFWAVVPCLPFDDGPAEHYGEIRSALRKGGTPIGPNDLLIAATARAHDLSLVTRNGSEFRRVAGLRVVEW